MPFLKPMPHAQGQQSLEDAVEQLQALQAHLCSYAAWGVPVVECKLCQQRRAVDQLHDYLLQCIEAATLPQD